ncbi:MAG TPA: aldehyde dehydrogenase, partial [Alphaproteobacteria bacterium]|nr:aldehyde dehydrogenase [Alphaproteobacteria bacterium]
DEAVAAGVRAVDDPAWRDLKPHQRADILLRISAGISARAEELAVLQLRDNGKPIHETRALVASAAGTFKYYAAACETMEGEITPSRGPYLTMSVYEPIGVVAAITPWNSPIASEAQKIAPALAAGNAVMVKPAEATPLLALALGRICEEAGVPKGAISVLPGKGSDVGAALVAHKDVGFVSFTGGTATGRAIAHMAADKLMPTSLELGGKSPNIVFADADMDHAINGVLFGIFSSQGQSCIAGSRLFVEERIHNEFVQRLVARTKKLRLGAPLDPATQMGPQISAEHRDKIASYVELGRREGGEVLCGGARPTGPTFDRGFFFEPTILAGLANTARICQEEIFGPVLCVLPFRDEDELVAQANDSVYGLACGLWTESYRRALRVARRIQAGTVWINTYKFFSISTPFGGMKESGLGREKGRLGIQRYMRQKSLYWGLNEAPLPWAD